MARPQRPENEREAKRREKASKPQPETPSERGETQGADKQRKTEPRGGHPRQKTTHPVDRD